MHYVNEFNHKKNMCMFAPVNVCVSACFFACISFGSASYLTQKLFSSLPSGRNTSHTHTQRWAHQTAGFSQCGMVK